MGTAHLQALVSMGLGQMEVKPEVRRPEGADWKGIVTRGSVSLPGCFGSQQHMHVRLHPDLSREANSEFYMKIQSISTF